MCDLVTALTVGSTVLGFVAQSGQADRQQQAVQTNSDAQQAAIAENAHQVDMKATDDMSQRAREAMVERGRLAVIGAESGLGTGNDRETRQSYFNEGYDVAAIEGNRKNAIAQNTLDSRSAYAQSQSQMNSIKQPSLIGAGLQIGGAYADYQTRQDKQNNSSRLAVKPQS